MNETHSGSDLPVDLDQAHRVLLVISLALAGGVALMAGVSLILVQGGHFTAFLGFSPAVRVGVAVFLALLLGASYPVYRLAGGPSEVPGAASGLQAFQTRVITAMAMREFVGMAGAVLILLSRDLALGGTMSVLAVASILLSLPRKKELAEAVRKAER